MTPPPDPARASIRTDLDAPVAPDEAWARLAPRCRSRGVEQVPLSEASDRRLAAPVVAEHALPRETTSAMDGFAVRAADGPHDAAPISGESRAGHPWGDPLAPASVVRISTGGILPPGADAIVCVEDAVEDNGQVSLPLVDAGRDVRLAGGDLAAGANLLAPGTVLRANHVAGLAAIGCAAVACHRRPVVSIVVTGDEVVPPGDPVGPGQVTDVHGLALPALVRAAGGVVREVRHARDSRAELDAVLAALEPSDIVVVTGGVSVGVHDHTRAAFAAVGADLFVKRLLLRPGQPTAIGQDASGRLWFGLPGNPVSAFAVAALLLVPAIRAMGGAGSAAPMTEAGARPFPTELATARRALVAPVTPDGRRWLALRAVVEGERVRSLAGQGSHMVAALAQADCLILIPPGAVSLAADALVDVVDLGLL